MVFFSDCKSHEDMDVDLDRDFLLSLRELKALLEKDVLEEHRAAILRTGQLSERVMGQLSDNFRVCAFA
jgi:hypothetical protein